MKHFRPLLISGLLFMAQISFGQTEKSIDQNGNAYYLSGGLSAGTEMAVWLGAHYISKRGNMYEWFIAGTVKEPSNLPNDYQNYHDSGFLGAHRIDGAAASELNYGRVVKRWGNKARLSVLGGVSMNFLFLNQSYELRRPNNSSEEEGLDDRLQYFRDTDFFSHPGLQARVQLDYTPLNFAGLTSHLKIKSVPGHWFGATFGLGIIIGKVR